MTRQNEHLIDRVPVSEEKVGEDNISIRLSGQWLARWRVLMDGADKATKVEVLRDCLSLAFACTSLDASGKPVEVVLRRRDKDGRPLPEEDLVDFLQLRVIQSARAALFAKQTKEVKSD